MDIAFKDHLEKLLLKDTRLVDDQGELKGNVVKKFANELDEKLIGCLLEDDRTRDHFFLKVKDVYVFKANDFIFFLEQNKLDNSFTKYANRIGLTLNGKFLKDNTDIVLDFPYKDCILEGGQSTEEGLDSYYEYDTELSADDKKKGYEPNQYNEKQAKRKEIFFNNIIAKDEIDRLLEPKAFTNILEYSKEGTKKPSKFNRNKEGVITDNLIVKGNNLLALHSLKNEFKGKVKLIYIDPPFNTGNDSFQYNDSFNHSTWLSFMNNRLLIAKTLMKDNGLIFINIDDIEEAYLKVLCDDIFGRENFINVIAVKSSTPSGTKTAHKDKTIIKQKDLILVYKKGGTIKLTPQYVKRENWDTHYSLFLTKENNHFQLSKLLDKLREADIVNKDKKLDDLDLEDKKFKQFYLKNSENICRLQSHKNKDAEKVSRSKKDQVYEHFVEGVSKGLYYNGQVITPLAQGIKKVYYNQKFTQDLGMLLCDFWSDIDFQNTQNEGGVSFPTAKKPENLISRIIELATNEKDIVLDYHLGSGTTCAVAHKMKRQYIGIEQMNYGDNDSTKRLINVINAEKSGVSKAYNWAGGGSFICLELAKNNEKAKELIEQCKSFDALVKLFDTLYSKYFLHYNIRIKDFKETIIKEDQFKALSLNKQKEMFCRMLDNNQLYVNRDEMEDKQFGIAQEDIALTKDFYQIKD